MTDPKGGSPFDTMAVTLRHTLTHLCKLTGDWRLVKVPGSRMEHERSVFSLTRKLAIEKAVHMREKGLYGKSP